MTTNEFKVGEHTYRSGRLSAFQQFDVARKMAPVLASLAMIRKTAENEKKPVGVHQITQAICAMMSPLPKDDSDMAINICLSVVARQQTGAVAWAPVLTIGMQGSVLMFEDIDLPMMIEIVWHVLQANRIVDFFAAPASE